MPWGYPNEIRVCGSLAMAVLPAMWEGAPRPMTCDGCRGDTKVIDSRASDNITRRRRECETCGARFTTYEVRDELYDLLRGHQRIAKKIQDARAGLNSVLDIIETSLPEELRRLAS